jgi:Cu(I)/Ag(I) efflux system membrane fusion protein
MKRKLLYCFLLVIGSVLFVQCSGDKTGTAEKEQSNDKTVAEQDVTRQEAGKPQFTVDEIFRKQITEVFDAYVELKDAFVSSDADKVRKEAGRTQEALEKVDMKLVSGPAHSDWMTFHQQIDTSLKSISSIDDIEAQRAEFSKLSGALYNTIKAYGLSGKTAYYEFCPMAFDDQGAYWLSNEEKIRNPYFGEKMLTCGSVQETLQ